MSNFREKLHKITTFVFDYDGVLTDGRVLLSEDGLQLRRANVKDGYALQLARKKGFRLAVITGSHDKGILHRCSLLNIEHVFQGVSDKKQVFESFCKNEGINHEEVLFMGDDLPDYHLMKMAGVSSCPADASRELKEIADYISDRNGGDACVRDVIEQVLKVKMQWFDDDAFHW
ncbi:MAG: HAD hydrolase family protein [Bacteroidales bacterium]|nr:HAD hydrolase family protein [Bacteroidales bacterium]